MDRGRETHAADGLYHDWRTDKNALVSPVLSDEISGCGHFSCSTQRRTPLSDVSNHSFLRSTQKSTAHSPQEIMIHMPGLLCDENFQLLCPPNLTPDTNDDEYWQHYENLNARYDKNFAKGVCAVEKMPGISVFTHGQCCKSGYQSTWS
ncbi:hypothetical protein ACET3Z_020598 [Daucus carota]